MISNFLLGAVGITPSAKRALKRTPLDLLAMHAVNEHGHVTDDELRMNALNMRSCGEIVSRFKIDPTNPRSKFVIVTTHEGWASTTIKLDKK